VYNEPSDPGAYGGINRLIQSAKSKCPLDLQPLLTREFVEEWAKGQQGYTLHRPARKHFPRRPIIAGGIDKQWQADLADMHQFADSNSGYRWLLVAIDTFSKFAWAVPVKTKSADDMLKAFEMLFE
jgi:hypothetical protein